MTPGEFPFWVVGTVLSETALPDPEQSYAIALLARGRGGSEVEINGAVGWFVWFRPYAPTEAVFDQTRSLSDFEKNGLPVARPGAAANDRNPINRRLPQPQAWGKLAKMRRPRVGGQMPSLLAPCPYL